jgi:hypothetical protein
MSNTGILGLILTYLISHPLVLIALLGFVYNLLRPKPSKPSPDQRKRSQELELQRKRLLEEQLRQKAALDDAETFRRSSPKSLGMNDEDIDDDGLFTTKKPVVMQSQTSGTNPNQQMTDFQADILAALGMKTDSSNPSPQETLRRQLAQKMGRTGGSTQTSQQPIVKKLTAQQQIIASREAENPTSRDSSGTITSSLKSEMTSNSTNNIVDSNAAVRNTSMQVKLDRTPNSVTSNSTSFGTTNDVVRGMIWSEILGKPKSSRR